MCISTPTPSVLVVDDDDALRGFLVAALTSQGYRTLEASDGSQVLQLVTEHAPSVILMDLVMPNQEGLATIIQLRKAGCSSKVVAMSGSFAGSFLHPAELLGAHATLAKPFNLESLFHTVESLLPTARPQAA